MSKFSSTLDSISSQLRTRLRNLEGDSIVIYLTVIPLFLEGALIVLLALAMW
jgi:hypothetical protein